MKARATKTEARRRQTTARPQTVGSRLIHGLSELRDALASGEPLGNRFTVRTVGLPDPPKAYDAAAVVRTRARLNVSQAIFAGLLGISPVLVRSWEYGLRTPSPLACRLLEQVDRDPDYWLRMVRRAS